MHSHNLWLLLVVSFINLPFPLTASTSLSHWMWNQVQKENYPSNSTFPQTQRVTKTRKYPLFTLNIELTLGVMDEANDETTQNHWSQIHLCWLSPKKMEIRWTHYLTMLYNGGRTYPRNLHRKLIQVRPKKQRKNANQYTRQRQLHSFNCHLLFCPVFLASGS